MVEPGTAEALMHGCLVELAIMGQNRTGGRALKFILHSLWTHVTLLDTVTKLWNPFTLSTAANQRRITGEMSGADRNENQCSAD